MNVTLYFWQRATALLLAPLVLTHLLLILYAVRGGLTATEILARTQGSIGWGVFYGLFVIAAALHASIGLRTIISEWGRVQGGLANAIASAFGLLMLMLGGRAIYAVIVL